MALIQLIAIIVKNKERKVNSKKGPHTFKKTLINIIPRGQVSALDATFYYPTYFGYGHPLLDLEGYIEKKNCHQLTRFYISPKNFFCS